MELLKHLQKELNTSIILITHDLGVVRENADDVNIMYAGRIVEKAQCETLFANPKHPYTQALLNAVPKINSVKLENIKGAPPILGTEILGCPFHPRCTKIINGCEVHEPLQKCLSDGSFVACHLY